MNTKISALAAAFLLGVGLSSSLAQTVAWGTSVSENPLAYTSNGNVDNGALTWELGWFTDGFIPDATNYSQWIANWNPVDAATHQNFGTVGSPLWSVSANAEDVGEAATSKQEWIFAYNDPGKFGTDEGEALLFREVGLTFPALLGQNTFDIANNPLDPADDTFEVVWGRVDREMYNVGGVLKGGGLYGSEVADSNAQPADQLNGTFEAQSGTWAAVPEPSSAGLLGLLGTAALLRRRRRA